MIGFRFPLRNSDYRVRSLVQMVVFARTLGKFASVFQLDPQKKNAEPLIHARVVLTSVIGT